VSLLLTVWTLSTLPPEPNVDKPLHPRLALQAAFAGQILKTNGVNEMADKLFDFIENTMRFCSFRIVECYPSSGWV
jgi:hypothetical protein